MQFQIGYRALHVCIWWTASTCLLWAGLQVTPEAKHFGAFGLRVDPNLAGDSFVTDASPAGQPQLLARMYLNLDHLDLGDETAEILIIRDGSQNDRLTLTVQREGEVMRLDAMVHLDDASTVSYPIDERPQIPSGWFSLELAFTADNSQGGLRLWLDGHEQPAIQNVDNGSALADSLSLGLLNAETSSYGGFLDVDDYAARTQGRVGMLCFTPAEMVGQAAAWPNAHSILYLAQLLNDACSNG